MIDYVDLLGVQFAYGGRGPTVYDCYGLVMECHRRMGVELPDYRSPTALRDIANLMNAEKYRWEQVASAEQGEIPMSAYQPGRVVEVRVRGLACHVGFIHRPYKFLHTWEDSGGVVSNDVTDWRQRVLGVYQYAGDAPRLPARL